MFPAILGHEGAGIVREVGPGVTSLKPGDHVIPLYTPECRQCEYCLNPKTNLCQAIRSTAGQGADARRDEPLLEQRQAHPPLHGHVHVRELHGAPGDRGREDPGDAPFEKVCYIGCGVTTGIGAVINTAKVEPGSNVVVFGLGGIGLNVIQGARMVGANMIVGVDLNPERRAIAEAFGMTHFVNPSEVGKDLVAHPVNLTGGGADYSFECVGSVELMRQRARVLSQGLGCVRDHRRGPGGRRDLDAPVPARDRARGRARRSAARAGGATCPKSSTGTWRRRSRSIL